MQVSDDELSDVVQEGGKVNISIHSTDPVDEKRNSLLDGPCTNEQESQKDQKVKELSCQLWLWCVCHRFCGCVCGVCTACVACVCVQGVRYVCVEV